MPMPFPALVGSVLCAALRPKIKLGLKWHGWVTKRLCTLTALMAPNGCAVMVARSAFTSPVSLVTQKNRWKEGGGHFFAISTNAGKNER